MNWTALLGRVHGVAVRKTSRHWIVHVECLYGRSPGELLGLAKNLGDRVAHALMSKYGVLLGVGQVVPDLEQPEPKQSGLRNKLSSIFWRKKKMSGIQYGKFELVLARNIRETEEIIVVPAIMDRESILQYGNIRSYRPTNEVQDAGFTPIALDKLLIPNPNIGDD